MNHPLVTITRPAWKSLAAQAAGHMREGWGLLIGKRLPKRHFLIHHVPGMTHQDANKNTICYDRDELAQARLAAFEAYKPLEPLGHWHTHIWPACNVDALAPQVSSEDKKGMLDGELEIILPVFPWPGYWLKRGEFIIQTKLGNIICRAEPWLRVRKGKVVPCRMKVR